MTESLDWSKSANACSVAWPLCFPGKSVQEERLLFEQNSFVRALEGCGGGRQKGGGCFLLFSDAADKRF